MKSIIITLLLAFAVTCGSAQKNLLYKTTQQQQSALYQWKHFDGNRINATINSAGPYADYLETDSPGLEWPNGSGQHALYTAGLWIIGKHRPTDSLRTAVMNYQTEFQPGPILTTFNTATNLSTSAANPYDHRYHVYKINKGDTDNSNIDYADWPGDLGAPYIDVNGNGTWDNGIDVPKIFGDQTLWTVINDANSMNHLKGGGTLPLGIEIQSTYFGFANESPISNVLFVKMKIINKSDADYDSTFIGLWSDTDVGDPNDDMVGIDTVRGLSFFYNLNDYDNFYSGYKNKIPACGFILLEGPLVPSVSDTGRMNGNKIFSFKNLTPYAFVPFTNGINFFEDPPLANQNFAQKAYNNLQGLIGSSGEPYINPQTNKAGRFVFPGDPVTQQGWTQSNSDIQPSDFRSLMSVGPFTFASNDTQEIVFALVIAQGINKLHSITELRRTADLARTTYENNFKIPSVTNNAVSSTDGTVHYSLYVDTREIRAQSVTASIVDYVSNVPIRELILLDNGTSDDSVSGDRIFSGSFSVPIQPSPYIVNLRTKDSTGIERTWLNAGEYITTSSITIEGSTVFRDDINNDGEANAGEIVNIGLTVKNNNSFSISGLSMYAKDSRNNKFLTIPAIPKFSLETTLFDWTNSNSYLSFYIPPTYEKNILPCIVDVIDSFNNSWKSINVDVPVSTAYKNVIIQRTSGKGKIDFETVIVDPSKIKDHLYVLYGIDSPSQPSSSVALKDSTTGNVLIESLPIEDGSGNTFETPITDGFKVVIRSIENEPRIKITSSLPPDIQLFYLDQAHGIGFSYPPRSSVHFSDVPNMQINFSTITHFTDSNGNGKVDENEKYFYDTTNVHRSQIADFFFKPIFGASSYVGRYRIPFAAFDISSVPPKQLSIVIFEHSKNNQMWDLGVSSGNQEVFVLNQEYDSVHLVVDTTQIKTNLGIPYYLVSTSFGIYISEFISPLSGENDITIEYSTPFSSRDTFLFNPIYTSIRLNENLPFSFNLSQNFPNPFNPATTIRYSLPKQTLASITIYNILGQKVRTVVNEVKNAGTYEAEWNGRSDGGISVASGIYFYRLTTAGSIITKKMLLLK